MLEVKTNTIQLRMDDNNLKFSFGKGDTEWNWTSEYRPKMECKEGTVYFDEALEIHHNWYRTESERESVVHLPDLR